MNRRQYGDTCPGEYMEREGKKKKPQIHVHLLVTAELRKELKQRALARNVSMSKYIIDAVMARIRSEQQYE